MIFFSNFPHWSKEEQDQVRRYNRERWRWLLQWAGLTVFLMGMFVLFIEAGRLAAAPERGPWILFEGYHSRVIKIQDGSCSLYVVFGGEDQYGERSAAIATGQGCK